MVAGAVEPVVLAIVGVVCLLDVGTVELWVDWVETLVTTPFWQYEAKEVSIMLSGRYRLIYQV